jgi:ArsR family transcriptional regulator
MDTEKWELALDQASYCRVFSNPKRILILWFLIAGERSVGDIAKVINASLQNTSQHIHLMKKQGILDSRKDGQTVYYRIADNEYMDRCLLVKQARKKQAI